MSVVVLCLVLLAPYGVLSNTIVKDAMPHGPDINHRFAKLEAVLESVLVKNAELESRIESVLVKNAELESRIERLEEENMRLKATAAEVEEAHDPQDTRENENDGENGHVATKNPRPMKTAGDTIKRRNSKLPRLVLSENASIGFTAVVSSPGIANIGQNQPIVYDEVITNVGGGYHIHTGVFTAPVSGVYVFSFDTMFEPGDSQFLSIVHDGLGILQAYGHGAGETRYITTSRTVVLQVNQGEDVWIRKDFDGPGRVHGWRHSSFSGWMLM